LTTAFKSDFRGWLITKSNKLDSKKDSPIHKNEEQVLIKEFDNRKKELIHAKIAKLNEDELSQYKLDFVNNLWDMHIASRFIQKAWFEHPIVLKTFEIYMQKKLLSDEELDFKSFKLPGTKEVVQQVFGVE